MESSGRLPPCSDFGYLMFQPIQDLLQQRIGRGRLALGGQLLQGTDQQGHAVPQEGGEQDGGNAPKEAMSQRKHWCLRCTRVWSRVNGRGCGFTEVWNGQGLEARIRLADRL